MFIFYCYKLNFFNLILYINLNLWKKIFLINYVWNILVSDYDDDRDDDYYLFENESEGDGDLLVELGIFFDYNFMLYFLI